MWGHPCTAPHSLPRTPQHLGISEGCRSLLSIFASHESIPAAAPSFVPAACKLSFLLRLLCASEGKVLLALGVPAAASPHLPPGKEQQQRRALCWARAGANLGASPDPAQAVGAGGRAVPVHDGGGCTAVLQRSVGWVPP